MQTPLRITFHRLSPRPELVAEVRRLAAQLDDGDSRITHCHVVLGVPDRHKMQGRSFDVHIEVGIPGDRVVVSHLQDAAGGDENPAGVIRNAFRAARKQLRARARRPRRTLLNNEA
jgi:hypothetical protein